MVVIVDSSGSVGVTNFERTKNFVQRIISTMPLDGDVTRLGLMTYGSLADTQWNMNDYTTSTAHQLALAVCALVP